jgi:hypothetical protein
VPNPRGLTGGRAVTIRCHHQIQAGGDWRGEHPQAIGNGVLALNRRQQDLHQGAVLQDPAHGLITLPQPGQITRRKRDLKVGGPVTELQPPKRGQGWKQLIPKPQPLQQIPAGMGQGIGPIPTLKRGGFERITELDLPARIRQSQGR